MIESFEEEGVLDQLIEERLLEIRKQKELWGPIALEESKRHTEFFSQFSFILEHGHLSLEPEGAGAAYILYDVWKQPRFIVKPTDEDIFCLENPKYFASPFIDPPYRVKADIPLYRSAQTEALCYELAEICHLSHITPKATLSLISSPEFSSFCDRTKGEEKLCSIQEYLKNTSSLKHVLEHLFSLEIAEEELLERFDFEDFEDIQLFLWLTFDNDAHPENFRVHLKKKTENNDFVYGIYKIDNSLSFPEKNTGFFNVLMYFPHAQLQVSPRIRSQIKRLPLQEMKKAVHKFGLASSSPALEERISILQKLIEKEDLTYYECNLRLALLEKNEGPHLALSEASIDDLEFLAKDLMKVGNLF